MWAGRREGGGERQRETDTEREFCPKDWGEKKMLNEKEHHGVGREWILHEV